MTPFYDPMIAKIIVQGEDRAAARARLRRALADTAVLGVATNLGFLARIVGDPDFAAGAVDTGFIERRREALLASAEPPPVLRLAAAALDRLLSREAAGAQPRRGRSLVAARRLAAQPRSRAAAIFCSAAARAELRAWPRPRSAAGIGGSRFARASTYARGGERGLGRHVSPLSLDGVRRTVRVLDARRRRRRCSSTAKAGFSTTIDPLAPPAGADRAGRTADRADAGARRAAAGRRPATRCGGASR